MAIGALKKMIGAGLDKLAKRKVKGPTEAEKRRKKAMMHEENESELLSMERLMLRTTNAKTKAELKDKIMKLKHKSRKDKEPPGQYKRSDMKDRSKPMKSTGKITAPPKGKSARSDRMASGKTKQATELPNFLKQQAGVLDSEVKPKKKGLPKMLQKQAY